VTPLRRCPHREILLGSLATPADLAAWAAALASAPCAACSAPVAPPAPVLPLPPAVALALAQDGRDGAKRAQAALDALGVDASLYPAIRARLASQPGTGPFWRRWWGGGVLVELVS